MTLIQKRKRIRNLFGAIALALAALPATGFAFGFAEVAAKAKELAGNRYDKPDNNLPTELQQLSYDQYRDIRFKPARSIWRDKNLPFELQMFHPGLYFNQPVKINLITNGVTRPL